MKTFLILSSLVLATCLMLPAQQPTMNPQGRSPATPPTFPSDQTRPAAPDNMPPDTKAPPAQPGDSSHAGRSSSSTAPSQTTEEGCLSGSDGAYFLQQNGATVPLQSDNTELRKHLGQQVRVTGTPAQPPSTSSADANEGTEDSDQRTTVGTNGPPEGGNALTVTSIEKLSGSCRISQPHRD